MSTNLLVLTPIQAAKALGTNPESVRIRMQQGRFDPTIGTICKHPGSNRFSYEIYPERLANYLGITVEDVFHRIEKEKNHADVDTKR
jgi:hypothetical protein